MDSTKLTVSRLSTSTGRNSSGRPPEQCSHGRNRVNTTSGGDGIPLPSKKQFTGEIDLTHLLSEMLRLFLDNNRFSGEVHFTYFPYNMTQLNLENNKLSGSLVIQAPTKRMCINVKGNQFNAIAVLHSKVHATIHLSGSGMTSVVDEMVHVIANGS